MAARPVTLINGNTCVIATSFDADYGKQHNVMAIHKDTAAGPATASPMMHFALHVQKQRKTKNQPGSANDISKSYSKVSYNKHHHQHSASAPARPLISFNDIRIRLKQKHPGRREYIPQRTACSCQCHQMQFVAGLNNI